MPTPMKAVRKMGSDVQGVALIGTAKWKRSVPKAMQVPLALALKAMDAGNLPEAMRQFGACCELCQSPEEMKPILFFGAQVAAPQFFSARASGAEAERVEEWRGITEHILRGAAESFPDDGVPLHNLGRFLQDDQRDEAAIECYRAALKVDPHRVETWGNLGTALYQTGDVEGGWNAWRHCLEEVPESPSGALSQAYIHLREGRYPEGWALFNERWKDAEFQRGYGRKEFGKPMWTGEALKAGAALLVHGEQGLGDHVQFARYVRGLVERGYPVVGFETRAILKQWMVKAGLGVPVYARDVDPLPTFTHHVSLMSLPGILGTTVETVPLPISPVVEPRKIVTDETLAVGIAWEGAKGNPADALRSIPTEQLAVLADIPSVTWVNLQFAPDAFTYAQSWLGARVMDGTVDCRNTYDTAAVMKGLDHIVCVDTLTAHLAGTLGCPTTVLHRFCREWRWGDAGERSPWYPSVRSLTQPKPHDWESVLRQVRAELTRAP